MNKSWDGKISNLKISNKSSAELFNELESLNPKERCERLRSLATIGLYSLNFLSQNDSVKRVKNEDSEPDVKDEKHQQTSTMHSKTTAEAQKELKGKLLGSV